MMQAHNDERRARLIDLSIAIQQIPAPTGDEGRRAAWVAEEFRRLGYACEVDALHNVYPCAVGAQPAPGLGVSAHIGTVLPAGDRASAVREFTGLWCNVAGESITSESNGCGEKKECKCRKSSVNGDDRPPVAGARTAVSRSVRCGRTTSGATTSWKTAPNAAASCACSW